MKDVMGIINLGESEENIKALTYHRPIASIPYIGRYRIIDFIISNMVNAGIENIGIFTGSKFGSLVDHLGSGKAWDLDRKIDRLYVLSLEFQSLKPFYQEGDIRNFKDHLSYIKKSRQEYVMLSKSYMVFNMDFKDAVEFHKDSGADITILYKRVTEKKDFFINCDTLNLDENKRVLSIGTNTGSGPCPNISMEVYIMKKEMLVNMIEDAISFGDANYLKEMILKKIYDGNTYVNAYKYKGYLACINSLMNYYVESMEILNQENYQELFTGHGLIFTKVKDEAPTKYSDSCSVKNSLLANGCIIEGHVENSVIFRGVKIKKGAVVKNSIIMQRSVIEEGALIENVILDKSVTITANKHLMGDEKSPMVVRKDSVI